MKKAELILSGLCIRCLLFWIFGLQYGKMYFVFTYLILSLFYLIFGFAYYNEISWNKLFKSDSYSSLQKGSILKGIATGLIYFLILCCILFQITLWPGVIAMGSSGMFFSILLIIIIFFRFSKGNRINQNSIRSIIFVSLMSFLFLLPLKLKLSVFYYSYPKEVKEAYLKYFETLDPNDWDKVVKELVKAEH